MGARIDELIDSIRVSQGPFFVARLGLRLKFRIAAPSAADSEENLRAIRDACREMGYDPTEQQHVAR